MLLSQVKAAEVLSAAHPVEESGGLSGTSDILFELSDWVPRMLDEFEASAINLRLQWHMLDSKIFGRILTQYHM
jgi:hypothetical protein